MRVYNVGDSVWWARCGTLEVKNTCLVCFGKLQVTLILGDGSHIALPCDYCSKGYYEPKGYTVDYEYVSEPELRTISAVNVAQDANGETREYRSHDNYILSAEDIFDTEAEAMERCKVRTAALAEEQRTRAEYIKANVNKKFSWNAGYHLREAKRKESEAIRHREKAAICKARGKEA